MVKIRTNIRAAVSQVETELSIQKLIQGAGGMTDLNLQRWELWLLSAIRGDITLVPETGPVSLRQAADVVERLLTNGFTLTPTKGKSPLSEDSTFTPALHLSAAQVKVRVSPTKDRKTIRKWLREFGDSDLQNPERWLFSPELRQHFADRGHKLSD